MSKLTVYGTLSLGGLIELLEQRPKDEVVRFDFGYFVPRSFHSYRGFYGHLALSYMDAPVDVTVELLLHRLRDAIDKTFEGYKGGSFRMHLQTPIWVAEEDEAPSTAIIGIADCHYMTILETRWVSV